MTSPHMTQVGPNPTSNNRPMPNVEYTVLPKCFSCLFYLLATLDLPLAFACLINEMVTVLKQLQQVLLFAHLETS